MKRGPTTFSLILGLLAVALLLALTLAATLSLRVGARSAGDVYTHVVLATALAADELSAHADVGSSAALAQLERLGVHFSTNDPPAPTVRVVPIVLEIGRAVGNLAGDSARVAVTQVPEPQIWIRSAHDPRRWIVLQAISYRQQAIDSTLFITLIAGLIALVVAALAARLLTRPLERLAQNAGALLNGEPVSGLLRGSSREVRRLAGAIGDASERLRSAAHERELMLAGISHDLRTPLARLRLALELGDAGDPQRRAAMVDDLEQLDAALEQCLAFVRDGRDEALRDIDIATIVGQLIPLRTHAEDWHLDAPPTLHARVRPTLLRRAIGNLMDNAERYGAAPYRATLSRDAENIYVRVADRGAGVAPELIDKLGQPFLRGDPARGGRGSGLGLSIVARTAQLHGGSLRLRNDEPHGFVAEIIMPYGSVSART